MFTFQIGQKKFLWLKKWKTCHGHSDLNGKEIVETLYKKELQKTGQTEFKIEKLIKRKDDKL